MSDIFSNTPGTVASDFKPLPTSLHPGKESAMSVEEEDVSQMSCPPPRSPSPYIKKEQNLSDESDTDPFIPADTYLKLNPMEEEATKKNPKSQKNKEEKPLLNEPVIISTSITTTHVKDLHELCQSQVRMTPSFEFKAELPLGFCAILRLAGPEGIQEFEAKGPYPSKKHAKEAAAGLGLEYLKGLPKNSKSMMHENPEKDDTNWVGKLSDWCNMRKIRPEFIDYATPGAGFSCEIKLPADPDYPGLEDEVFGDKNAAFKNKRSAKVAASKAAVIWLQKNSPASSPNGSVSGGSKKTGKLGKVSRDVIYPKGSKPAAIVNLVCPRLGVNTPEYKFTPDLRTPGMYDVCAIIRRPNGPKDVMIGPVKNLYGKKKAREEMSVGVYNWIKKEAERQGVGIYEAADTDEP